MSSYERRYEDLKFRAYRRAAKTDHTRRLGAPWYIRLGDLLGGGILRADANSVDAIWRRQAQRYAEWWVVNVAKLDVTRIGTVSRRGGPHVMVTLKGGAVREVQLPEHLDPSMRAACSHSEAA